jgi:HlyD family secretion protein
MDTLQSETKLTKSFNFFKSKITIGIICLVVLIIAGYFLFHRSVKYQFITVTSGAITQTVSVTGNTTPTQSVSLSFQSSGVISHIYSALGKQVSSGQILAELNTDNLSAGLHQAQANLAVEQAKLSGLQSGASSEDIAVSQAAVDKANQDLANMYGSIADTSTDSYTKANDAVRTQLNSFFSNAETQGPLLTYTTANTEAQNSAQMERYLSSTALNEWQTALANLDQSNDGSLETLLQNEIAYLATVSQLLNGVGSTLNYASSLNAATLATYKADVSVALNEVNLATTNLNTLSQSIASQKLTVSELQAQLDLKRAPPLPSDISAQQAQVAEAQASVESAQAQLANAQIVAPISGTVTQFDAKIGQLSVPSTPLVSIMSNSGYEVDAGVSETDIGKVSLGNKVAMTLDAFPNETFTGSVFYIAPSETNLNGVITYQIKISFDKVDSRLKSGLTANVDINTMQHANVLILPQYAILQNDQGTFVETLENNKIKQNPVVLGIADESGNVEVVSGVTLGEQVLNIGLKTQ